MEKHLEAQHFLRCSSRICISPILANIYLLEFDKYVENYIETFYRGNKRACNPEYHSLINASNYKRKQSMQRWNCMSVNKRLMAKVEILRMKEKARSINWENPMDELYRRLTYVCYADDWICGVIGRLEMLKR